MKTFFIAMLGIATAFTMTSCNKEHPALPEKNSTSGKSVITASIESILTKTAMRSNDDGNEVVWSEGDNIYVADGNIDSKPNWTAKYKLDKSSAGSSSGIFRWAAGDYFYSYNDKYCEPVFDGDLCRAVYPFDLMGFHEDGEPTGIFTWKTDQVYSSSNLYIPMIAEATGNGAGTEKLAFKDIGGLLRLTIIGTATIKSIEMRAGEAMSGTFDEICEGCAIFSEDNPGALNYVKLDCGEDGVTLSPEGTDFIFSLPGVYHLEEQILMLDEYSDVTVTLTDIGGNIYEEVFSEDNTLLIERSKITTAPLFITHDFKPKVPVKPLPGKFSVSATKQVHFSRGNLWADSSKALHFEDAQWKITPDQDGDIDKKHMSHFTWSSTVTGAIGTSNSGDYLFCDESHKASVDGSDEIYYAPSKAEWMYLFNDRTMTNGKDRYTLDITYGGIMGLVLYPDDYNGPALTSGTKYTDETFPEDCVFLPAAGYRYDSKIYSIGHNSFYWSSSANGDANAYHVYFHKYNVVPDCDDAHRHNGHSVRLITDVTE